MVRPREFDEDAVLEGVMRTFWQHGYSNTSIEHLVTATGLNRSSLYGSFGRKPELYRKALERYSALQVEQTVLQHGPRVALERWFADAVEGSDDSPRGCLVVNSLGEYPDLAPELQALVDTHLSAVRQFFATMVGMLVSPSEVAATTDILFGANVAVFTLARTNAPRSQLHAIANAALDRLPAAP
ncbi:MAG: TetR/AcrR family transcriptional regulator [Nannocystales bacterium]